MTQAEVEAHRLGHSHLGTEHLLLGILAAPDSAAAGVLAGASVMLDACRDKVAEAVAAGQPGAGEALVLTARARRSLDRAGRLSLRHRSATVGTVAIMVSVLDVEGTAGQVLRGLGVDVVALRAALAGVADDSEDHREKVGEEPGEEVMVGEAAVAEPGPHRQEVLTCPACGAALEAALAHRVLESHGDDGTTRRHLAVYCRACHGVLGLLQP